VRRRRTSTARAAAPGDGPGSRHQGDQHGAVVRAFAFLPHFVFRLPVTAGAILEESRELRAPPVADQDEAVRPQAVVIRVRIAARSAACSSASSGPGANRCFRSHRVTRQQSGEHVLDFRSIAPSCRASGAVSALAAELPM